MPERFANATPTGTSTGKARSTERDSSAVSSTILTRRDRRPRAHAVATNLLRYLGPGVTLVSGPAGQSVVMAFAERRLFAVIVLTIRDRLVSKIEATADPAARAGAAQQS